LIDCCDVWRHILFSVQSCRGNAVQSEHR
jgi:hypothetical protein